MIIMHHNVKQKTDFLSKKVIYLKKKRNKNFLKQSMPDRTVRQDFTSDIVFMLDIV